MQCNLLNKLTTLFKWRGYCGSRERLCLLAFTLLLRRVKLNQGKKYQLSLNHERVFLTNIFSFETHLLLCEVLSTQIVNFCPFKAIKTQKTALKSFYESLQSQRKTNNAMLPP